MPHTKNAQPGFKNINYPVDRAPQICPKVYLTRIHPVGCAIKIIIELAAEHLGGNSNSTVTRKFKESGITRDNLYKLVTEVIPWFPEWYLRQSGGAPLTPNIIYNRFHKGVAYDNMGVDGDKTRRGVESDEHYNRSKALIPYAHAVQKLWQTQDVISLEDIERECGLLVPKKRQPKN